MRLNELLDNLLDLFKRNKRNRNMASKETVSYINHLYDQFVVADGDISLYKALLTNKFREFLNSDNKEIKTLTRKVLQNEYLKKKYKYTNVSEDLVINKFLNYEETSRLNYEIVSFIRNYYCLKYAPRFDMWQDVLYKGEKYKIIACYFIDAYNIFMYYISKEDEYDITHTLVDEYQLKKF